MLLIDVATASAEVGATSARLAKMARIAELLARAADEGDPKLVAVVVSWLSGELPQRQIGVGWATLRSLPPAAPETTLTVAAVDAALSEIGAVAGKGSQARRAELITDCSPWRPTSSRPSCAACSAGSYGRAPWSG